MPETAGGSATRWGPLFGARAAAWAETWEGSAGWGTLVYEHVLARAEIGPTTLVLDCGCGAGRFARMAADRGARVAGIDASESVDRDRGRAHARGRLSSRRPRGVAVGGRLIRCRHRLQCVPVRRRQGASSERGATGLTRRRGGRHPDTSGRVGDHLGLQAGVPSLRRRVAGEHEAEWHVRALGAGQLEEVLAAAALHR